MICCQNKILPSFHFPQLNIGNRKAVSSQYPAPTSGKLVSELQPAEDSLAMQKEDICTFGEREKLEQLQPNWVDGYCCLVKEFFNI